jgi:hypothetical protein
MRNLWRPLVVLVTTSLLAAGISSPAKAEQTPAAVVAPAVTAPITPTATPVYQSAPAAPVSVATTTTTTTKTVYHTPWQRRQR